jgi:hypothetical protein
MQREDALAIAAPNARKPSRVGMQLVIPLVRTNGPAQVQHDDPALGVGQLVVELLQAYLTASAINLKRLAAALVTLWWALSRLDDMRTSRVGAQPV